MMLNIKQKVTNVIALLAIIGLLLAGQATYEQVALEQPTMVAYCTNVICPD